MMNKTMESFEKKQLKKKRPEFNIGDTVDVHVRIVEGDKERVQIFTGTVISRKGSSVRETFTVRRIVSGEGVERVFPFHSPRIQALKIKRRGKTRRAKLFYLRERVGKAVRLTEQRKAKKEESSDESAGAPAKPRKESGALVGAAT